LAEFVPSLPETQAEVLPAAAQGASFSGWHPSTKVRLFPNIPAARFEGAVHEMVNASLARAGVEILTSDIPVHHFPELRPETLQKRKQEIYLELGRKKVQSNPQDPHAHAELADQYADMGNYAGAARCYREALRLQPDYSPWLMHLGGVLFLLGRAAEAKHALELALRIAPDLVGAWRNLAAVHSAMPLLLHVPRSWHGLFPGRQRRVTPD
jgi:tetratricopeptide (TPR) repeat protein